jgi:glycosyltransferase involved in cell wall biosynthesis
MSNLSLSSLRHDKRRINLHGTSDILDRGLPGKTNTMNVLHLISSGGFYGAENVVSALTRDLRSMDNWAAVGLFENRHQPETKVAAQFLASGAELIRIPCRGRVDRDAVRFIRGLISSKKLDVLHTHGYKADIYGYLAARRSPIPIIATCHNWTHPTFAVRTYEFLDAFFLRRFDRVVAVSESIAREARQAGIHPDAITTIDNGIDLSPFSNAQPSLKCSQDNNGELLIGTAGRLVELKGLTYFLQAAQMILREFPNVRFVIVGEGPERARLEQLARDSGIADRLLFTGSRPDMADVYVSLDIFVLASIDEGMPMVILEALASGRAVVATNVGAVSKLVESGKTGVLVPPRDATRLAAAIRDMIKSPVLREQMGRNGQSRVREEFSSEVMTRKYLEVYREVLQTRQGFDAQSGVETTS